MIEINHQGVMWEDVNKSCAVTITFHTISSRTERAESGAGASGLQLGAGKGTAEREGHSTFYFLFVSVKS